MTKQLEPKPTSNPQFERYKEMAKRRSKMEKRVMQVWEHQGREDRQATNAMQVLPADMDDPPAGWVMVAVVKEFSDGSDR